jgi:hypothetical protein
MDHQPYREDYSSVSAIYNSRKEDVSQTAQIKKFSHQPEAQDIPERS